MPVQRAKVLELKVLVLTAAVTEIARVRSPRDAATVAGLLAALLTESLGQARLSTSADDVLATDLAPLMAALQRDASATMA